MSSTDIVGVRQPFIDGKFRVGDGPALAVENPATEEVFAEVETCSADQVEEAILAARRSFEAGTWAGADGRDRAAAMVAVASFSSPDTRSWPPPWRPRPELLWRCWRAPSCASLDKPDRADRRPVPVAPRGPNTPRVPSRR